MQVNQYAYVAVDNIKGDFKFQLMLPYGATWSLCKEALKDYEKCIEDMERASIERVQAQTNPEVKE